MDGVGSVSFIRWNVSERRNVRVRDDVSVQKERWVWYDYSSQWRETLFMYLSERSDFEWLWFHIESLSSSSFISFWEIPNDESKISHSVKLWWEMRPYTILWSIRISYRIQDFRFFWNRGHHMIPFWLDYFRVCDHGCQDEIQRHGNMYPLILQTIWTCSPYP